MSQFHMRFCGNCTDLCFILIPVATILIAVSQEFLWRLFGSPFQMNFCGVYSFDSSWERQLSAYSRDRDSVYE